METTDLQYQLDGIAARLQAVEAKSIGSSPDIGGIKEAVEEITHRLEEIDRDGSRGLRKSEVLAIVKNQANSLLKGIASTMREEHTVLRESIARAEDSAVESAGASMEKRVGGIAQDVDLTRRLRTQSIRIAEETFSNIYSNFGA